MFSVQLTEGQCKLASHVLGLEVTTAHDMERHHNVQVWNNPELEEGERNYHKKQARYHNLMAKDLQSIITSIRTAK